MRVHEVRRFARHYVEMVVAMLVGMMALYSLWMLATAGAGEGSVLGSVEVESLVMATTMAVPMAAWMRFRRHGYAPTLLMSTAMYAGFVVVFPPYWAGAVGAHGVMMVGHVAMFVLMLVAMLLRRPEYTGHTHVDRDADSATPAREAGATISAS